MRRWCGSGQLAPSLSFWTSTPTTTSITTSSRSSSDSHPTRPTLPAAFLPPCSCATSTPVLVPTRKRFDSTLSPISASFQISPTRKCSYSKESPPPRSPTCAKFIRRSSSSATSSASSNTGPQTSRTRSESSPPKVLKKFPRF